MVNIFIANLDWEINSDDLKMTFSSFGTVSYAHVVFDPKTKKSKGFGYVEMESTDEAINAIEALNGMEVNGRKIDVKIASPKGNRPEKKEKKPEKSGFKPKGPGGYNKGPGGYNKGPGGYNKGTGGNRPRVGGTGSSSGQSSENRRPRTNDNRYGNNENRPSYGDKKPYGDRDERKDGDRPKRYDNN